MSLQPRFESPSDGTGIDIIDPVETRYFSLATDEPVELTAADTDEFAFPVETARRVSVGEIRLPHMIPVDVRTPAGDPLASVDSPKTHEFEDGDYLLELHSPIKVYMRVSGSVRVTATPEDVTFEFGEDATIEIGARSYHSAPAATIMVPEDPEAIMQAVSAFSSALKTTSPERAWPTLRGHPPRIERGDELSIPAELDSPDTGIRITVPPEFWAVYTVAPLSYYLGAEVVPGDDAHVSADSGAALYLGEDPAEVADATEALLKRVFFLDCVTRTEGLYPDDLHEREVLESHVDLDFAELYDASIAERLAVYLSVPDEAIDAIASPWHRVTHVQCDSEAVEFLPSLVNDLSLIRPERAREETTAQTEVNEELNQAMESFLRSPGAQESATNQDFVRSASSPPSFQRSGSSDTRGVPDLEEYVRLPEVDALEQTWVGDGTPIRGTKLIREAFAHENPEPSDGSIDITVVCNDEQMREELDSVGEIYGSRDDLPVNVSSKFAVSTGELRDLLAEDHDVFHFIGHIDGTGFQCPDGILDAGTVEETNATTILLNGCRSHDQGVELVKSGASAAVVSLSDLYNSGAVEVGETLARLLHHGFGIGSAMKIIREYTSIGNRYVVVGDPSVVVAQCDTVIPTAHHLNDKEDGFIVVPYTYPSGIHGIGTNFKSHIQGLNSFYIGVEKCGRKRTSLPVLKMSLVGNPRPLIIDNKLVWTDSWLKQLD